MTSHLHANRQLWLRTNQFHLRREEMLAVHGRGARHAPTQGWRGGRGHRRVNKRRRHGSGWHAWRRDVLGRGGCGGVVLDGRVDGHGKHQRGHPPVVEVHWLLDQLRRRLAPGGGRQGGVHGRGSHGGGGREGLIELELVRRTGEKNIEMAQTTLSCRYRTRCHVTILLQSDGQLAA